MMDTIQAIILGLVQGVTEFIPVSSSGHLVLFKDYLGLGEIPLAFDITLHLATLLVVLFVFRTRIIGIFISLGRWVRKKNTRDDADNLALVGPVLVATLITALIGYAIDKFVTPFETTRIVAIELIASGIILAATALIKEGQRGYRDLTVMDGLVVGLAQGLGVFSGISRSGITIAASLGRSMRRDLAGEFSFLLSVPAVLGAFVLHAKDLGSIEGGILSGPLAIAFIVAFASGLGALTLLLKIVRKGNLAWFAPYLALIGTIGLFLGH